MPVERRERAIAIDAGQPATGGNPMFNGRRQPSCGGTSRMMREYQVRICERLGVKFPGSTRPDPRSVPAELTAGMGCAADYRDTIQRAGSARMTLSRLRADVTSRLAYEEIFENVVVLSWRQ